MANSSEGEKLPASVDKELKRANKDSWPKNNNLGQSEKSVQFYAG